ncbi:MAG: sulfatase [Verrucomicrobia bacterium]|nr:sulfatase [Verrucomicrobiota bacterium]
MLGVFALFLLPGSAAEPPPSAGASNPNVLFIVVDDLNPSLGCYGNTAVKSPNIDRLAARGVRFDRAYCQYPLCGPSRASFLSGRRPETTGIYVLNTPPRTALPDAVMLPQFFRERGYFTAGAGKVAHNLRTSDEKSWDAYEDGPGNDPQEKAAIESRYGGGDGRPAWHVLDGDGSQMRDGLNAATTAKLIAEKSAAKKSFFLAAGFHKPHLPWTAPKKFFDLYDEAKLTPPAEPAMCDIPPIALQTELSGFAQPASRAGALRGYYACISYTDSRIGMLLDELDRLDLWKTTLVVLVGDNGFHLGDHGGLWAKLSAFDASTRVPLIFAGGSVPAGRVIGAPVELIDIYPTLADLAGFPAPAGLEGRSLVSLMRGASERRPRPARTMVYHYDTATKRDVLSQTVIGVSWRYTEWNGGEAGRELYSLAPDPHEYQNRATDPALVSTLREAQAELKKSPEPRPGPANRPRALAPDDEGKAKQKKKKQ